MPHVIVARALERAPARAVAADEGAVDVEEKEHQAARVARSRNSSMSSGSASSPPETVRAR